MLMWLSVKSVVLKFQKDLYSGVKFENITSYVVVILALAVSFQTTVLLHVVFVLVWFRLGSSNASSIVLTFFCLPSWVCGESVWIVHIQITPSFSSSNDLQTVIFAKLGETCWCGRVQNFVSCHCYKSHHQIRACIIWCKAVELHIDLSYLKENGQGRLEKKIILHWSVLPSNE